MHRLGLVVVLAALGMLALAASASGNHATGGAKFNATPMTGAQECSAPGVCGVGDPDGTGTAALRINVGQRRLCYELTVANIDPATAAHIHVAPAGEPGPVVIPLITPDSSGVSHACATGIDRDLLKAIMKNPENYYVNVHNAAFPGGAVRGQLEKGS